MAIKFTTISEFTTESWKHQFMDLKGLTWEVSSQPSTRGLIDLSPDNFSVASISDCGDETLRSDNLLPVPWEHGTTATQRAVENF